MTIQFKQRIVGICVLVFLALIIFPWLFGHDQTSTPKSKIKVQKRKTLPIELSHLAKEPVETPVPVKPIVPVNVDQAVAPADESEKEITQTHIVAAQMHLTRVNTPLPKQKSDKLVLKEPRFDKIKLVKPASMKPSTQSVAKVLKPDWAIQLGSFSNKANAEKLMSDLKKAGYQTYCRTSADLAGNAATRVLVEPRSHQQGANAMIKKIEKSFNIHGIIVKVNPCT